MGVHVSGCSLLYSYNVVPSKSRKIFTQEILSKGQKTLQPTQALYLQINAKRSQVVVGTKEMFENMDRLTFAVMRVAEQRPV